MHEGSPADLKMIRMILENGFYDGTIYHCEIITYRPEEERIYILAKETELPVFSLDGIYECKIFDQDGNATGCKGMIRERYWNKLGRIVEFQIQNGFYKNLLN